MKWTALMISIGLANAALAGGFGSQHEVSALTQVLQQPIPDEYIAEAREFDDQLMIEGEMDGQRVYLVTDERVTQLEGIVERLLVNMGQDPRRWVVRVFDTEPKTENAFVTGGKYIYVFTGFLEAAQSEDEIAFVLGHELGHSLLQHRERRSNDWTQQLAILAQVAASVNGSDSLNALTAVLKSGYSQLDEQEADAIGVAIATRAGYNALRGADFFVRNVREQQAETEEWEQYRLDLDQMAADLNQQYADCEYLQQNWDNIEHNEHNVALFNEECGTYNEKAQSYVKVRAQYDASMAQRNIEELTSSHPDNQSRVAAVAALSDFMRGRRGLDTLSRHRQAYRVMSALTAVDSILVADVGDSWRPTVADVNSGELVGPPAPVSDN